MSAKFDRQTTITWKMASNPNKIVWAIFVLIICYCKVDVFAQSWSHSFSYNQAGNEHTFAMGVEQTTSGYIVSELTFPLINDLTNRQIRILLLDQNGDEIGYSIIAIPEGNIYGTRANNLHLTPWNTYLFVGTVSQVQTQADDTGRALLVELDESGNILNSYIHETGYFNAATSCVALEDGSIIIGGHTSYAGNPLNDAWAAMLIKLTPDWELEWDYAYLQSQIRAYEMQSVTIDQNGNIFLGGQIYLLNTSGCVDIPNVDYEINGVIIKTSADGEFLWKEEYGGCNWEGPAFVSSSIANSILVACGSNVEGNFVDGYDFWAHRWILNISPLDGSIIWETFTHTNDTWDGVLLKTIELQNGNIITCGYDQAFSQGFRGELALFSSQGDSLWMRAYMFDDNLESWFNDVIPSSDGGFVACGRVFPNGTGMERSWVIKVDEHGCLVPGCHLVDVEESKEEFPWSIGPNPTVDQLYVFIGANPGHNARLELYDLQGRMVKSVVLDPSKGVTYIMDMGSFPNGQYILKLVTENGNWSEKVVKE